MDLEQNGDILWKLSFHNNKRYIQNFYGKKPMENSEKNNEEIGLEEKNTLLQAWSDFKDSIFNVLFVILDKKSEDEEEESLGGLIFESGLDYLQIMAFPFNDLVIGAWNGGNSLDSMSSFFGKFNVSSYLPSAPYPAFLFILYALIFIILLIVIDIIYVSYSFTKKKFKFTFPLVILAQVVPLFVTVLFLPITETLLNVVQCKEGVDSNAWYMVNFPEVVCWQGWHLFHTTITLLFVTLFVIISSIVALALFEPRVTTKKLTARQNSNGEVVFIVNKIVLQFFFSFSPFGGSAFYVVIMFVLSFWQFWYYTIKKPYYSKVATKFFKICSTYYFWTALMLLVGQLLQGYGFNGALLVWISGLPFFAIIIYYDGTIKGDNLYSNNLKFKTGEELESHIALVLELICNQKDDKNSSMLLIGYIERHKEICNESDCPLTAEKKKKKGESTMDYNCMLLLKQIDKMFRTGIKKFPECTKLRLSYAFFHLEHMHNKKRAYEEFTESFNLDPSFEQQFNIYRFKKIIKENLEDRKESESDLVETIRLDNHVSLLEEAMVLSAKLHKDFWAELKEEKPDLKKLNAIGSQITETGNAITENYTEITKITSSNCEVLYSYAHYLILVNGDFTEGRELLTNARKIYQDKQIENKNDQEEKLEIASLTKMTRPMIVVKYPSALSTPHIVNSNLLFTEISGYQRTELFDRDLSLIVPDLFAKTNTQCFNFTSDDKERQTFIKHKFSHLVAVTYELTKKEEGEWHIIFKLAPSNNMKMVLLSDQQGMVTDFNLLATNSIQPATPISLPDLGLNRWEDLLYRKPNGSPMKLTFNNQPQDCLVQIEPVVGMTMGEVQAEDEEQALMVVSEKEIGWRVVLLQTLENENEESEEEASLIAMGTELDEGVLELYENPNTVDIFISQLAETKQFQETHLKFELKEKIITMRLLNNQIKMVSSQGNDNECEQSADKVNQEDDREVFKFDDQTYQAKLRTAINTNLNHEEVITLRTASLLFLALLFGLCIFQMIMEGTSVASVDNYVNQINNRAEEYSWLTTNLMATIDGDDNYTEIYNNNQGHLVDFQSEVDVTLTMENNLTVQKNLKDAVIFLNSRLMSYFLDPSNNQQNLLTIFTNYFTNIYPAFITHPSGLSLQNYFSFYMGAAVLTITILMMIFWIYISLTIDKKRYDIMIWFLDIPIPYVSYLGNHCDLYLKQYLSVKELSQKGIPLDEDEDNFEEFSNQKNTANEEEIEEQIKTRKSLISKNKKETLISKINLSALKVTWLLLYGLFFPALLLGLTQNFYSHFAFLEDEWIDSGRMVTVDSTLYLGIEAINKNITLPVSLPPLLNQLRMHHRDVISEWQARDFNEQITDFALAPVAESYTQVYFENLCNSLTLSAADLLQCKTLVGNKLESGYEVYSKYMITPELVLGPEIEKANRKYVVPAMTSMIQTWDSSLTGEGESIISLCTIMLYVFIILSVLCFMLLWLYYLRKLNTELNQTIQMLNMIPFKLLPKSRKETKMFIAWIIREANKTKHENE